MKPFISLFSFLLVLMGCTGKKREKPNIIYILADDLGYGELGVYGQTKIETPNIDRLAGNGVLFTDHYTGAPVSAPARCILLTGLHSGHAQVRGNDEWAERGDVWSYRAMIADSTLEGQRPMSTGTITIGTLLSDAGYKTAIVGKWGLGAPNTESIPNKMGFDFFYGYNCQRQAHTYYPVHLYKNMERVYLNNDTVAPGTKLSGLEDPYDPASYSRYELNDYSPDLMFREITSFVKESKDDPFFLYWATPIPHNPLQAPQEWVQKYVDKFGDEMPYDGSRGYFPHRYPHAAYAAMVSYLDDQIGRLVDQLKELGIYENTIIIFTSDNGPTWSGGADSPWFDSARPFRSDAGYGKGHLNEGGIRVPLIVSWPRVVRKGTISNHKCAFWDLLPTLCEIAGTDIPDSTDGISFLPAIMGKKQREHEYLYWEFPESGGQQAVITGEWKALRKDMHKGNTRFQLFNIKEDPGETTDVSDMHPDILQRVNEIVIKEHTKSSNPRWQYKLLDDQ